MYSYDTLTEALSDLQKRGYTTNFNLQPDCLECSDMALRVHPEEFEIDEVHRFEGMTDPGDSSVVYAITSDRHQLKGVLVDAYGPYSEALSESMIRKLKIVHRD